MTITLNIPNEQLFEKILWFLNRFKSELKFYSNQEEFMEFIVFFIQDNKKVVDNYFAKKSKTTFKYKKLDPMENYYKLSVEDSVVLAKKLKEKSHR